MRRIVFPLGVALLTFCIGVGMVMVYLQLIQHTAVFNAASLKSAEATPATLSSGKVVIKFQRFLQGEYGQYAEFRVINGSSEPLYYPGYGKAHNCLYQIKRGDYIRKGWPCSCGTGLEERELLPGEMTTFQVETAGRLELIRETGNLQAGFDFLIGKARRKQTVWSDEVIVPEGWELIAR